MERKILLRAEVLQVTMKKDRLWVRSKPRGWFKDQTILIFPPLIHKMLSIPLLNTYLLSQAFLVKNHKIYELQKNSKLLISEGVWASSFPLDTFSYAEINCAYRPFLLLSYQEGYKTWVWRNSKKLCRLSHMSKNTLNF